MSDVFAYPPTAIINPDRVRNRHPNGDNRVLTLYDFTDDMLPGTISWMLEESVAEYGIRDAGTPLERMVRYQLANAPNSMVFDNWQYMSLSTEALSHKADPEYRHLNEIIQAQESPIALANVLTCLERIRSGQNAGKYRVAFSKFDKKGELEPKGEAVVPTWGNVIELGPSGFPYTAIDGLGVKMFGNFYIDWKMGELQPDEARMIVCGFHYEGRTLGMDARFPPTTHIGGIERVSALAAERVDVGEQYKRLQRNRQRIRDLQHRIGITASDL
ncbi:MAG: hypothetical protein HYX24_00725 [Candidatus Aenigmarchaeota archaeon]|nr:hypothetical protein [Candidatus Aenigmarchaeota archaeon]